MASSGNQQIAWLFIFLLAGHEVAEASRVSRAHQGTNVQVAPTPTTDAETEKVWQSENSHCGSFMMFCGGGDHHKDHHDVTHEVHRCASQPLKGDIKASTKCRVTDEWMLDGTEEKPVTWWVNLQVKLLKAKAVKFSEQCAKGSKRIDTDKCLRRMQHILHAVKFISKAASTGILVKMSPAQQKEIVQTSQAAQDALSKAMMSDEQLQLFNRLVAATNQASLKKDPKRTITKTLQVLEQDILADDSNLTKAEYKVREIEEKTSADSAASDVLEEGVHQLRKEVEIFDEQLVDEDQIFEERALDENEIFEAKLVSFDETFDSIMKSLDEVINEGDDHHEAYDEGRSLIELKDKYEQVVKYGGFVAMVILIALGPLYTSAIMVSYMITWISASLLGCTAYIVGHNSVKAEVAGKDFAGLLTMTPKWGSCAVSWVAAPFKLVYQAVKWTSGGYRYRNTPDNQTLAEAPRDAIGS